MRMGPPRLRLGPIRLAALIAAHFIYALFTCSAYAAGPASALQILGAADHGELTAEISATSVSRVALAGDRISRVMGAPDGFAVEHDAKSGDLYLRPLTGTGSGTGERQAGYAGQSITFDTAEPETVTLFLGTEKGFTYRLSLTATVRDSAQILIRNPEAAAPNNGVGSGTDVRVSALAWLIRAVVSREPLAGYAIEPAPRGKQPSGSTGLPETVTPVETWRGPRFTAEVVEVAEPGVDAPGSALVDASGDAPGGASGNAPWNSRPNGPGDAAQLASLFAPGVAAVWLSDPGSGPYGGRLGVVVREHGRAGDMR